MNSNTVILTTYESPPDGDFSKYKLSYELFDNDGNLYYNFFLIQLKFKKIWIF